jgi:hypothetical protein
MDPPPEHRFNRVRHAHDFGALSCSTARAWREYRAPARAPERPGDTFGERRERKLQLGNLLNGHPRGDHLDHFGRILAEHVRADDSSLPGFHDQRAEALRLTIGNRAQQILITNCEKEIEWSS